MHGKLEPGLAAMYSKPRDLSTSSMKSEPGRSAVNTSTAAGAVVVSAASSLAEGTGALPRRAAAACCAFAAGLARSHRGRAKLREPFRKGIDDRSIEALGFLIDSLTPGYKKVFTV